jgi:hypothetical protein
MIYFAKTAVHPHLFWFTFRSAQSDFTTRTEGFVYLNNLDSEGCVKV